MLGIEPAARLRLVLPRAELDRAVVECQAHPGAVASRPWLAHGPLTWQPEGDHLQALAGPFSPGPVGRAPASAEASASDGAVVLAMLPAAATPPANATAWEAWMQAHAPGFRLASPVLDPALAVLWLRADGLALAACRHHGWPGGRLWRPVDELQLPGAEMLLLTVNGQAQVALPPDYEGGRYSRLAGALGPSVLARLQRSRIALVGLGRTGSTLASSLARMGVGLQMFDPDLIEPHNLDGDLPPLLEGRSKAEGAVRQVRGLMRPGAPIDARVLPVASPVAGTLLAGADVVISCVDNDAARLWASAWALALAKPHLDIATGLHPHGAEADLRLLPPGTGCLACRGGFAQQARLAAEGAALLPEPTPADFRQQRQGSLRSWGVLSAHAGLRMLERMYAGTVSHALFRRLAETATGGFTVQDEIGDAAGPARCSMCTAFAGRGLRAVTCRRLDEALKAMPAPHMRRGASQIGLDLQS